MKDTGIAVKKVSLCSLDNFGLAVIKTKEDEKSKEAVAAPEDKFFFVRILFLLLGLMHFIPYSFFVTANAYWMYKFRDVNADLTDTDARTVLQTHFSPSSTILNLVFSPVTMLVSTFFGFKIRARVRIIAALSIISFSFIAGTAFVKINTDSWQLLFFIITMILLGCISIANCGIAPANMAILAKFPTTFMNYYLVGEGFGGICSAILQILSLAMGTSTEVSALFYFISGSTLMTLTLILFYFSKYNKLFNYYVNSSEGDVNKSMLRLSEIKDLAKLVWAPTVTFIFIYMTVIPIMPNVTALVVSEDYGSGSEWSDKYFVPVITFLYSDVMGLLGRITSSRIGKTFDGIPLSIFMLLRMLVLVPLVYLCNAQPRNHLPVVFPHDWQYTLVLSVLSFSNGYAFSMLFLDVVKIAGPEKAEDAFLVMLTIVSLIALLFLPITLFSVDVL